MDAQSVSGLYARFRRRGLALKKWRGRDPRLPWYGRFMVMNPFRNNIIGGVDGGGRPILTLEEADDWLREYDKQNVWRV